MLSRTHWRDEYENPFVFEEPFYKSICISHVNHDADDVFFVYDSTTTIAPAYPFSRFYPLTFHPLTLLTEQILCCLDIILVQSAESRAFTDSALVNYRNITIATSYWEDLE